jgi:hypothetical protein
MSGCFQPADRALDKQCTNLAYSFFRLPLQEQIEEFRKRDAEDQYPMLICGNQAIHPPAQYLIRPLAQEGQPAAAFLKKKLLTATDDLTIRDIIMVFAEMNRSRTYDVINDRDLMTLIQSRAGAMKDPGWKIFVNQQLSEIGHSS